MHWTAHSDPYIECLTYKYSHHISSPSSVLASELWGQTRGHQSVFIDPLLFKAQHAHSVSTSDTCVMGFLSTNMWCNTQGYFCSSGLTQLQLTYLVKKNTQRHALAKYEVNIKSKH